MAIMNAQEAKRKAALARERSGEQAASTALQAIAEAVEKGEESVVVATLSVEAINYLRQKLYVVSSLPRGQYKILWT